MAQLDSQSNQELNRLLEALLEIVDQSKNVEFLLLDGQGENMETMNALDELAEITQQATELYQQVGVLRLRIAEAQPVIPGDMLAWSTGRLEFIQNRIPALRQSIAEVQRNWML